MATLSQVTDYIRENICIWNEEDGVFIEHFENCVRDNGLGMYVIEFNRGDVEFGWMSEANDIYDIFNQDPDYFESSTTLDELENGILHGEEQVFFNITSI
jgi:hypothetical protein